MKVVGIIIVIISLGVFIGGIVDWVLGGSATWPYLIVPIGPFIWGMMQATKKKAKKRNEREISSSEIRKMRRPIKVSGDKYLYYSPEHHGYYDPEDIGPGFTIFRFRRRRKKQRKSHKTSPTSMPR